MISAEIETISPQQASCILETNKNNRSIKRNALEAYKRDMLAGNFQVNGQAIVIDENGDLLDGQHRLTACVQSDVPLTTLVVRGAPSEVRATIDSGVKRTHGDRLSMRGIKYASLVSAVTKLLFVMANDGSTATPSSQELDGILELHDGIVDSAGKMHGAFPNVSTTLSAVHYIATYNGLGDRAEALETVWRKGIPDYDNCPMHAVRERLVRTRGTPTQISANVSTRLICRAWLAFAKSAPLKSVRPTDKIALPEYWTKRDIVVDAQSKTQKG